MYFILIRNVKFSTAECNSFNMRKKNIGNLASKKISGGSHAKKQSLGCKVASFRVQSYTHQDAKLQLLKYKVTPIKIQSCNFRSVKLQTSKCNSKFFRFQLSIFSNHQHPTLHQKALPSNCIIIQFECIFMQFGELFTTFIC